MSRLALVTRPVPRGPATKGNSGGFRPDIQGLRAVAVTMVVVYHLFPSLLPGGFAGVDVFFVISGYLITGHLWRGYRGTGKVPLIDFWGRRARRLVPAAATVLAVTWIGARLIAPASELPADAQQILASALYFQNWQLAHDSVDYLQSTASATPVQHFWSLSVEEQFYLVWPLLFLLAALVAVGVTRAVRRRAAAEPAERAARVRGGAVAVLTVALVAGSLAYSVWDTRQSPPSAYFVTTTRMWELGAGGLLALAPAGISRLLGRQGWLAWAGLAAIAVSAFTLSGTSAFPGYLALLPVLGAAAVIAGGSAEGRYGPSRLMSARTMVFLGGISYSLYLWHFPIISLFTTWHGRGPGLVTGPLLAAVSVAVAWLSKKYIEDPVRLASWLRGHGWRSVSTALAAAVPVVLVALYISGEPAPWDGRLPDTGYPGAAVAAAAGRGTTVAVPDKPVMPAPARATEPSYWLNDGCLDNEWSTAPKLCTYGDTKNPRLTVALVGDSMAGNWWAPLRAIANQEHWKLVTELHGNCTFAPTPDSEPSSAVAPSWQCGAWSKTVLHDLLTTVRPQMVITAALPKTVPGSRTTAQSNAAQGTLEASYWKQLRAHGISVVGISESPTIGTGAPGCVEQHGARSAQCETPASQAIPASPPSATASRLSGAPVVDMNDLLCPKGECPAAIGNVLVYFDDHHLTQQYGETMTPYLRQRLLATGAVPEDGA